MQKIVYDKLFILLFPKYEAENGKKPTHFFPWQKTSGLLDLWEAWKTLFIKSSTSFTQELHWIFFSSCNRICRYRQVGLMRFYCHSSQVLSNFVNADNILWWSDFQCLRTQNMKCQFCKIANVVRGLIDGSSLMVTTLHSNSSVSTKLLMVMEMHCATL